MRVSAVCFSGHRNLSAQDLRVIQSRLFVVVERLINCGAFLFFAGGARGFDTLAALAVLKARERYPHIKLLLVLPFNDQAKSWSIEEKMEYDWIFAQADEVEYISPYYRRSVYYERNRRMADQSDICVCYLTHPSGGTKYTVDYCRKQGIRVLNLAPKS